MKRKMIFGVLVLAAVCCLIYCVTAAMVRSGSHFYVVWGAAGVFFGVLAFLQYFQLWTRIPVGLRRTFWVLVAALVGIFVIAQCCILSQFGARGEKNLDYIIVLGAQMREDGPSIVLRYRLDKAYEYLVENGNTICVVSGGKGTNEPCTEAEGMKKYLVEKGISPERILMEDRSTDTSENIAFSAGLIGSTDVSVGIVTNNFHVFRGVQLARHAGFTRVCGIAAPSDIKFLPNNMLREVFGLLKDLVMGNLL